MIGAVEGILQPMMEHDWGSGGHFSANDRTWLAQWRAFFSQWSNMIGSVEGIFQPMMEYDWGSGGHFQPIMKHDLGSGGHFSANDRTWFGHLRVFWGNAIIRWGCLGYPIFLTNVRIQFWAYFSQYCKSLKHGVNIIQRNRLYSHKRLYHQSGTNSSWGPYYCCAKHSRIACFPMFKFNLCYSKNCYFVGSWKRYPLNVLQQA